MKAPFIRQVAEVICWQAQRDPLAEWMRGSTTSTSEREKEKSCFIVRRHPKQLSPTPRVFPARPTQEQKEEFERLAQEWRNDVMFSSDTTERVMHPAYQRIIGMGRDILPLLLHEVAETHEHWFWALESITGEDPVSPEDSGDVVRISRAWVEWGRQQGFLRQ